MATDCTTLTLVDAAQDESALLEGEKQDSSFELKDCHEGTYSAAPVAENEFSSSLAIADPKIEPSCPSVSLLAKNSVSGDEDKVSKPQTFKNQRKNKGFSHP